MKQILDDIQKERQRQTEKWGEQNNSYPKWISILTEEVGEAAKEANDYEYLLDKINNPAFDSVLLNQTLINLREELVQVAAVAVQIIEKIDKQNNPSSVQLFKVFLSSDSGKISIKVYAIDEISAIDIIMKSEKCPRSAITKVEKITY